MELTEYWLAKATKGLHECAIPEHMHGAVLRYLTDGIEPGDFLSAVLGNDLKGAVFGADYLNKAALCNWAEFVTWHMPSDSQGSRDKQSNWKGTNHEQ